MDPTEGILIKTFSRTTDAEFAASQLRAQGIDYVITSDDCGGMYPPLGVIKLLVDPASAETAREILQQRTLEFEPAPDGGGLANETPRLGNPPPRVLRFNSGLIVGSLLGALLHFGYTYHQDHRDARSVNDYDKDGFAEEEIIWRDGRVVEQRFDRNGDGRWDWWTYSKDGLASREEADNNLDGRIDEWRTFSTRQVTSSGQVDTDFNGLPDVTMTYSNGIVMQADWRPNGTNAVLLRQLFRHSVLVEELRDLNGDGIFDVSIQFDPFMTPIHTNNLPPTIKLP